MMMNTEWQILKDKVETKYVDLRKVNTRTTLLVIYIGGNYSILIFRSSTKKKEPYEVPAERTEPLRRETMLKKYSHQ